MSDTSTLKLYERPLRLGEDWDVSSVDLDDIRDILHVTICYKYDYWADRSRGEVFRIFDFRGGTRIASFGQHGFRLGYIAVCPA